MSYGVELSNVSKRFGHGEPVVRDFNLAVDPSSFVSLLGPSGCGKTTTLRMIAGLETPTTGEIRISGETVFSARSGINRPPHKRNIGFVFQSYALWPHMTVSENLGYPLVRAKLAPSEIAQRVRKTLDMLKVAHLAQRYPGEISGGQQQRIALGRAIINPHCKTVLFDEPLSNLDARLREDMRMEIRALQEELKFTAIYVTHDHAEALSMSDRVVLMHAGEIEREGSPSSVFHDPGTQYVAEFFGTYNILPAVVKIDDQGNGMVDTPLGRIPLPVTDHYPPPGSPVNIAIPIDGVALSATDRGGDARLAVVGVAYYGNAFDIQVVGEGCALRCRVSGNQIFTKGQNIFARVTAPPLVLKK